MDESIIVQVRVDFVLNQANMLLVQASQLPTLRVSNSQQDDKHKKWLCNKLTLNKKFFCMLFYTWPNSMHDLSISFLDGSTLRHLPTLLFKQPVLIFQMISYNYTLYGCIMYHDLCNVLFFYSFLERMSGCGSAQVQESFRLFMCECIVLWYFLRCVYICVEDPL